VKTVKHSTGGGHSRRKGVPPAWALVGDRILILPSHLERFKIAKWKDEKKVPFEIIPKISSN
jgi:hypothetical protein